MSLNSPCDAAHQHRCLRPPWRQASPSRMPTPGGRDPEAPQLAHQPPEPAIGERQDVVTRRPDQGPVGVEGPDARHGPQQIPGFLGGYGGKARPRRACPLASAQRSWPSTRNASPAAWEMRRRHVSPVRRLRRADSTAQKAASYGE